MGRRLVCLFVLTQIAFLVECADGERVESFQGSENNHSSSSTTNLPLSGNAVYSNELVRIMAELETDFASISNYVYSAWPEAVGAALRMRDKIMTLPPELGKQYAKKMLKTILTLPIDHLQFDDRYHALDVMWRMGEVVWWQGASKTEFCEILVLLLTRLRDSIENAGNEGNDRDTRSFIAYVSANLKGHSDSYEQNLAYRLSSKISARDYAHRVEEVPDEEFAIIKAKFEKFLGRPIRTYEEIVHEQMERSRQLKLERERRRGGPDVQVDVGDL